MSFSASPAASSSWWAAASWSRVLPTKYRPTRKCAKSISAKGIMADALLTLDNIRAGYGEATVLNGISLEVPENGSLALLGRNGVGKSTLLQTIMGFTRVGRGSVTWRGEVIT